MRNGRDIAFHGISKSLTVNKRLDPFLNGGGRSNRILKKAFTITRKRRMAPKKTIHGCLPHHGNTALIASGIILCIPLTPKGWKLRSRRLLFFAAVQQLLDTGRQLRSCEWFGNVIVKPTFKTLLRICMGDLCRRS